MMEVTFQRPEAAWLLLAAAALVALSALFRRRGYAAVAIQRRLDRRFRASRLRRLPVALACLGVVSVVAALMEPTVPYAEERIASRGLDIAIVLDLSSSMEEVMRSAPTTDRRTRLDVTKRAIDGFISRRTEDRIGIVVFSDNAYVVSPLTRDHRYLQRYVSMIDEQVLRSEGMTAIGEGIAVADMLLRKQAGGDQARNQLIVVFTDGEHNHGRDPVQAVEDAYGSGHRIHLIGVDLDDEVKHKPAVVRLVRSVEEHGGRYFTADTGGQLAAASAAIDRLETGMLVSSTLSRNAPAFTPFAGAAVVALCAALMLAAVPAFVDLT